jgi:hypothetical protein
MRNTAIEIRVNHDKLTKTEQDYLKANFDYQYNANTGFWTLWIHDDGNFPFKRELFQYMHALIDSYNRETGTRHLNIYIETTKDNIDEYGREITLEGGNKRYFKNLVPEDLFSVDLENVILKKELNEIFI